MADIAASVLARLKNKAKESGRSYQLCLQLFCQEEFLRRLEKSKYAENLVLKGGLFLYSLTDFDSRVTVDVDFLLRQIPNTPEQLKGILEEVIAIQTGNDFVTFEIKDITPIAVAKKYAGMGVSACATCDGFFYRKKTVAVVGGGDTACEEATYLAGLAAKVYLLVRKPFLRASKIMQERVLENPKIEVLFEHNAEGLFGENGVEGVHVVKRKGEADEQHYDIAIDGFFLAIGHKPNSDIFKPWVKTDETGYILTEGDSPRTGVPGVFAAGDVADPHYRQAITAAGSGCKAAIEAERYLAEHKL